MKTKINLTNFSLILLLSTLFSCDKVNDIVNPKTDVEKLHEYINSTEWKIDTIRTQISDIIPIAFVDSYPSVTSGTVTFSKVTEGHGYTKGIMTRTIKMNNKDTIISNSYLISDVTFIKLYFPNPNIGLTDIGVTYSIKESSDNKFTFTREENLVNEANGALYGYAKTVFKLKK